MSTYLLTANPSQWAPDSGDHEFLEEQAQRFSTGEPPRRSSWSTRRTRYTAGDRVFLLLQGTGPRGIIASGYLPTGNMEPGPSFRDDGTELNYVTVDWDAFVAPEDALPTRDLEVLAPNTWWRPQSSGNRIKPEDEAAVEKAWTDRLDQYDHDLIGADEDEADGEPSYAIALTKVRLHQRAFRRRLLKHYPNECAYCGLDVTQVLDAAHLVPDSQGGAASVKNGRLLCANHHRAFDAGLLQWNKKRFVAVKDSPVVPPPPHL